MRGIIRKWTQILLMNENTLGNDVQAFLGAELFESTSEKWEKERY